MLIKSFIINKTKTSLTKNLKLIKIQKKNMHRANNIFYCTGTHLVSHNNPNTMNMSVLAAAKLKKNAVKTLANDGSGTHTHVMRDVCIKTDCEKKDCAALCDTLKETGPKGHNTHKPPIGRFCRFISETDANGKANAQYYVSTNQKKSITAAEKASYGNAIKNDSKQQPFIDQHKDKYE